MSRQFDAARFDREELSTIIGRAAEVTHGLQEPDDRLGLEELVAVADDVGISRSAVVTALAESWAGVVHERRILDRIVGRSQVWSISQMSSLGHDPSELLQHWLEVDHGLRARVRSDGVVVAEPKSGLAGLISTGLRRIGGRSGLDRARSIQGATASIDEMGSVCLVADVGNKRAEAVAGGAAFAGGTGFVVATIAVFTTPFVFLGLPLGVAGGIAVARAVHQQNARAISSKLELTTEAVVRGETPEHPVERLIRSRTVRRRRTVAHEPAR